MTCFFCKGGYVEGFTTHTVENNDRVIIVKNVPCLKCDQCGETSYLGGVYERLEKIIDSLGYSLAEVAIIKYSDVA